MLSSTRSSIKRYKGLAGAAGRVIARSVAIDRINPAELARPSGFSHVVTVTPGRLAFLAGQTALDASGRITGSGVVEQFGQALANLLAALRAAGGEPADLVSVTIYAVDLADYRAHARELGEVWRRLAGRGYPAMAAVGVQRLWDDGALVELQGVAALGATGQGSAGEGSAGEGSAGEGSAGEGSAGEGSSG
jgi:enamine deaminase RidA (YjgF/YER057c/UK114 family)